MNHTEAKELLKKYNAGKATDEERAIIENWYVNSSYPSAAPDQEHIIAAKDRIWSAMDIQPKRTITLWPRIAAAASIFIFLSLGTYFYFKQDTQQTVIAKQKDILPGHNQATLILASGQKIILTKGLKGKLAQQGQTAIQASGTSGITYITAKTTHTVPITYNTLATAKGEQSPYPLILADGTKVWLNSASSITFPTAFNEHDRKVVVTGEAYFEVKHHTAKPFRVIAGDQTIEDIGTHFNINAYSDEPVLKTTLLEGSIKISKLSKSIILRPGQQAIANNTSELQVIKDVNSEEAIAWKNGYFRLNDDNIYTIMRQLSRWYNIDVEYSGNITTSGLNGKISRYKNISQVLKMLESTRLVHFKIEGRRVTVLQ